MIQKYLSLLYKGTNRIIAEIGHIVSTVFTYVVFYLNNVKFKDVVSTGIPYVLIARGSTCMIGKGLKMHNGLEGNPIGRPQRCTFVVDTKAVLTIGDNVGLSGTVMNCQERITIGNDVMIGGGTCIYDSDYHALHYKERHLKEKTKTKPVSIGDHVFIGAHSTILKGVTIGENAVIGACSVVTKSVPPNEIWAGNPAVFVKKLSDIK